MFRHALRRLAADPGFSFSVFRARPAHIGETRSKQLAANLNLKPEAVGSLAAHGLAKAAATPPHVLVRSRAAWDVRCETLNAY